MWSKKGDRKHGVRAALALRCGPHSHHVWAVVYFIFHLTLFWFGYSANEVVTWASRLMKMVMWVALIKRGPPLIIYGGIKTSIYLLYHTLVEVGGVHVRCGSSQMGSTFWFKSWWHLLHGDLTKQLRSLPLISWKTSKTASCSLVTWIPSLVFFILSLVWHFL